MSRFEEEECASIQGEMQDLVSRAQAGSLKLQEGEADCLRVISLLERVRAPDPSTPPLEPLYIPLLTPLLTQMSSLQVRRLAEGYTEGLLEVFASRAASLARALGVDDYAGAQFSESEVRTPSEPPLHPLYTPSTPPLHPLVDPNVPFRCGPL
eukprot:1555929-Pyramimonas_sp.AAC.1